MTSPKSRGKCKSTTVQQQPENRVIDIKATSIMHSDRCTMYWKLYCCCIIGSRKEVLNAITNGTFNFEVLSPIGDLKTDMRCRMHHIL